MKAGLGSDPWDPHFEAADIDQRPFAPPDAEPANLQEIDAELQPPKGLPLIDTAQWLNCEPPARESAWGDWWPLRQTTLGTGEGGIGKGLLTQQLLSCSVLGRNCLGMKTRRMRAIYVTAEDDPDELWRREEAICAALGVRISDVIGDFLLCSLTGERGVSLAEFDINGRMRTTDRWGELKATVQAHNVGLIALDNATDLMAGDHNDIHQVAEFVNLITGLAIQQDGATLLLHHPNKMGADWLGSVAWHNKVRSRWVIKRGEVDGDADARAIYNPKANYGPSGGRIPFRWFRGAFVRDEDLPGDLAGELAATAAANAENDIFLTCLRERTRQSRAVSERHSPTFAPSEFAKMSEAKGLSKAKLEAAMNRLFRLGAIERAELWKGPDRKSVYGLRETAGNAAGNGAGDVRETVQPLKAGNGAANAGETHTVSKDTAGAALGAAAPSDRGGATNV